MASLILGGVGAGLGFIAGGPAGALLGFNVGALVGGLVFSHSQDQSRGKLDDLRITGSSYGSMIPTVYGSGRVGGTVIWATNLKEHHHDQHAGKGGGPTVRNFTYTCSFAISVCRGPIYGIRRIWAEDLLIYDSTHNPPTRYNIHTPYLGTEAQTADSLIVATLGAANVPAYRGQAYVVFEDLDLTNWGNRIPNFSFEVIRDPGSAVTIGGVAADLADQCGMAAGADYDFSGATDVVEGLVSSQRGPAYSIIEPVLQVFAVDVAEVDGKLVAVTRGGASAGTVAAVDMGARDWQSGDQSPPALIESVRHSDLSLPFKVELGYASSDRIYEQSTQAGIKHSRQKVQDQKTINTALTMSDILARQRASMALDVEWLERVTHSLSLGLKWLKLCPPSPFIAVVNGSSVRMRVTQCDVSPLGQVAIQAVTDASTSALVGDIGGYRGQVSSSAFVPAAGQTEVAVPVPTIFDLYSGPELRDEDGLSPGFYLAATGPDGWLGAAVYYSVGGTDWTPAAVVTNRADFGLTTSVLPNSPVAANAVDTTSSLGVELNPNGALTTAAPTDVVNGVNACLVGLEVGGYQNVASGAGNLQYTLTNITRGRRGSPMTGHASPERFWHLNDSIVRANVDPSLVGQTVLVKCVSPGEVLADVVAQSVVIAGNNYPYVTPDSIAAIVEIGGELDGMVPLTHSGVERTYMYDTTNTTANVTFIMPRLKTASGPDRRLQYTFINFSDFNVGVYADATGTPDVLEGGLPSIGIGPGEYYAFVALQGTGSNGRWRIPNYNQRLQPPLMDASTSYMLTLGDLGRARHFSAATAVTVTVPPNSSVKFPLGALVTLNQAGAGQVTVVAGAGVTIVANGGASTNVQNANIGLRKVATNTWLLENDLIGGVLTETAQAANKFKGGPSSGAAAVPTYRLLEPVDVPAKGYAIELCSAFTPAATGADAHEPMVPYDPTTGASITWSVVRIEFRVAVAGGAPSVTVEKSTVGNAAFGAGSTVGTVTFGTGDSEGHVTASLGTVASGNKLRMNPSALGTATGWTVTVYLAK